MEYRVGDKVRHMSSWDAVVTKVYDYTYEVSHLYNGFKTVASEDELRMIKMGKELDIGDKVLVKKTREVGEITAIARDSNGKLMDSTVGGVGTFYKPYRQLRLLRRSGEDKDMDGIVGSRVRIMGHGGKKHNYRIGDLCVVDDRLDDKYDVLYLLIRESDGFEQVVTRKAFTIEEELRKEITPADDVIDMAYAGAPQGEEATSDVRQGDMAVLRKDWNIPPALRRARDPIGYAKGTVAEVIGVEGNSVYFYIDGNKAALRRGNFDRMFEVITKEDEGMTQDIAKVDEEKEVLRQEIAELHAKNEELRKEKVAEEYGVVEKNHLWQITILIPSRNVFTRMFTGSSPEERTTEIVTEGQNMVEAAIVAEGMAKGIDESATVIKVAYQRVLGAIK